MPARLLAFDTSTETLAVALAGPHGRHGWNGPGGATASTALIPRIGALLAEAGLSLSQLDAIGFGQGPGAFTGLRTSCAVAQGLAFGAGRPVLPLDSLLIVAEDARQQAGWGADDTAALDIVMDARMGELYAGRYGWRRGHWQVLVAPALLDLETLNRRLAATPPRWVAGSALAAFGAALRLGDAAAFPVEADRAAALSRVAQAAWAQGAAVDPAQALPLYLRDKVALTVAERAAVRAAAGALGSAAQARPAAPRRGGR
jgi:tRNA threonylcarbamoyladenosine biosynthesis protein TsaB